MISSGMSRKKLNSLFLGIGSDTALCLVLTSLTTSASSEVGSNCVPFELGLSSRGREIVGERSAPVDKAWVSTSLGDSFASMKGVSGPGELGTDVGAVRKPAGN